MPGQAGSAQGGFAVQPLRQLGGGLFGSLHPGSDFCKGGRPRHGDVVAEGGEAAIVRGAEPLALQVFGNLKRAVTNRVDTFYGGIARIDHPDESGLEGLALTLDDVENARFVGFTGHLQIEPAAFI